MPRWFPLFDALPVTPALLVPLLFARRFDPVLLPGLPLRPLARRLSAAIAAIALPSMAWAKPLCASLQQAPAGPRPARQPFPSVGRLPFAMPCRILVRAHGRSCSQKLRPWRGMSLLSGATDIRLSGNSTLYLKSRAPVSGAGGKETMAGPPARVPGLLFPAMGGSGCGEH